MESNIRVVARGDDGLRKQVMKKVLETKINKV